MPPCRLVVLDGQEGAGKSTLVRALLPHTPHGAQIDAEDVGQVNPWVYDDRFKRLLFRNVADLVRNFWGAGYVNVIAGSFVADAADYLAFRPLVARDAEVYVVQLHVAKDVRDRRRITRAKRTTQEWRDAVDLIDHLDPTLRLAVGDDRYHEVDTTHLSVAGTVERIKRALPEIYGPTA